MYNLHTSVHEATLQHLISQNKQQLWTPASHTHTHTPLHIERLIDKRGRGRVIDGVLWRRSVICVLMSSGVETEADHVTGLQGRSVSRWMIFFHVLVICDVINFLCGCPLEWKAHLQFNPSGKVRPDPPPPDSWFLPLRPFASVSEHLSSCSKGCWLTDSGSYVNNNAARKGLQMEKEKKPQAALIAVLWLKILNLAHSFFFPFKCQLTRNILQFYLSITQV